MMKKTACSAGLAAVLLAGFSALVPATASPAGNPVHGRALYQTCAACHNAVLGESLGPNLHGIIGRQAAAIPGYDYSPAMKKSGLVWTEANLRAFIADPAKTVPGTRMQFPGYPNEGDVEDIMAYLRTQT